MHPLGCLPHWGREGVTLTNSMSCHGNDFAKTGNTEDSRWDRTEHFQPASEAEKHHVLPEPKGPPADLVAMATDYHACFFA